MTKNDKKQAQKLFFCACFFFISARGPRHSLLTSTFSFTLQAIFQLRQNHVKLTIDSAIEFYPHSDQKYV